MTQSIQELIQQLLDEGNKLVFYPRHSEKDHKDGTKQRTGSEGMALGKKLGRKFREMGVQVTDVFAGYLTRTWETLQALTSTLLPTKEYEVHPYVPIGDNDLFGKVINDATKKEVKDKKTNWEAVQATNTQEAISDFMVYALAGLQIMFEKMVGDTAIVPGHSPVLEAAAESLNHKVDYQPGSCEGLIFAQNSKGEITVVGKISFK